MAACVCKRAMALTSSFSFGRPPGLPDTPGTKRPPSALIGACSEEPSETLDLPRPCLPGRAGFFAGDFERDFALGVLAMTMMLK